MIQFFEFSGLTESRWKNGAGSKRDIASGSHADGSMAWMFGMADIERDAPFSEFPGARRWFSVVGAGAVELTVELRADDLEVVRLDGRAEPYGFRGDVPTRCRPLTDDPVRVFNVMTSGRASQAEVRRDRLVRALTVTSSDERPTLVFVVRGAPRVSAAGRQWTPSALDSLLLTGNEQVLVEAQAAPAEVIVASV